MRAYSGYSDWLRNSNSAARFREAFALADQMDPPLKMACVEKLHRIASAEWESVQEMAEFPLNEDPSGQRRDAMTPLASDDEAPFEALALSSQNGNTL